MKKSKNMLIVSASIVIMGMMSHCLYSSATNSLATINNQLSVPITISSGVTSISILPNKSGSIPSGSCTITPRGKYAPVNANLPAALKTIYDQDGKMTISGVTLS